MAHHHCRSYARSDFLRQAAAQAGQGLPAIEPGMPAPAGTGLSRRSFLLHSAGLGLAVYGGGLLSRTAIEDALAAGPSDAVVVSVFMDGGIDSLSVLAPVSDPLYRKYRPKLALGEGEGTPFSEDERLHWHPAAAALRDLHAEGKVSVMPAVGYENPDQSHFTSRHFWEVGQLDTRGSTGWMGRYLDRVGATDNPLQGLSLDGRLAPSLATARVPVAAVAGPESYSFWARGVWGEVDDLMLEAISDIGSAHVGGPDAALAQAGAAAVQSMQLRRQLAPFVPADEATPAFTSPVTYPRDDEDDEFPQRLAALAAMLAAGMPLRCVAISAPGEYDTHDNQGEDFAKGLKLTCDSLAAFQRDLEARGIADRVIVHVWSEFGRRAEENGSDGTDHGAAGVGFVIGTRAAGRMVGEFPGLAGGLDSEGNLKATSDFRGVYSALLEQWLGHDAGAVIPNAARFARPGLIK